MRRPLTLASLLLLGAAASAQAAAPAPAKPVAVSPDLLEFLADWQGADGQWVDPMTFTRIDPAKVSKPDKPATAPPHAASASPAPALDSR